METLRIADWLFEPELNQLSGPPGTLQLEPRTSAVLFDLATHPGEVRLRDDILQAVWEDAFVGEAVLTHAIWELRKAFGDDARQPRFIQTVPRRGYRLVAPILESGGTVVKTILVSDLVGSTGILERLGDEHAALLFERCDRLTRDLLVEHGGQEIDKTDGYLALFERPVEAVRFSLAYHQGLAELSVATQVEVTTRVGIHLGEVVLRENPRPDVTRGAKPLEVEGLAKPLTARLMSVAKGGQTLMTRGAFDVARRAAEESLPAAHSLRWLAHGGYLFQGIEEAVEVFEVGREGSAPLAPPADSKKVRRLLADGTILGWRPAPGLEIPQRPHWALERKLGEGGFGEVWLTRHQKTDARRVFKFCVERDLLRSLQREVTVFRLLKQTLGDRHDITRILDWNFDDAPYFLEIQHSESGSLHDWAESQGGLDRVPLPVRLEIVAQIAEALAAAHSVGVLHKDVKPGNILIGPGEGDRPQAKLTDFGIGRITDKERLLDADITFAGMTQTLQTEHPSSSGTRLYMAPELLEGKAATIQADIYALGVVLYQAVVGELDRAVATGWRRNVNDELLAEDIAACVDGAPERRPASALEIAVGLRNLDQRREQRAAERRQRQQAEANRRALERARRRRKVLGSVVAIALLVLIVVSILAIRENNARREAGVARREANLRRDQAEGLIGFMLGDLSDKLTPLGRLDILNDVGDAATRYFASMPEQQLSAEELFRHSQTLSQIGQVRREEGDLTAAMEAFQESLKLARNLAGRTPQRGEWQAGLGASHFWVGSVRLAQGHLDDALESFQAYLDIARHLVEADPGNEEWQLELAYAQSNIGSTLEARGDLDGALSAYEATLAIKRKLVETRPEDTSRRLELADQHNLVGSVLWQQGKLDEARDQFRGDQALAQDLVALDPDNAIWREQLATSHNYLGRLEIMRGDMAEAGRHFLVEQGIEAELVALDPSNARWRSHLALTRLAHGALGGSANALDQLRSGRETFETLLAEAPENLQWRNCLASAHTALASALEARGDTSAALWEARQATELLEQLGDRQPPPSWLPLRLSEVDLVIGRIQSTMGEHERARDTWARGAETIRPAARNSRDPKLLGPWVRTLLHLNRVEEAEPVIRALLDQGYREPRFISLIRRTSPELVDQVPLNQGLKGPR